MTDFQKRMREWRLGYLRDWRRQREMDGTPHSIIKKFYRVWQGDYVFTAWKSHEIDEEEATRALLTLGYTAPEIYHLLRTRHKREKEPAPPFDPTTFKITKTPSEERLREMREIGLSEESIQQSIDQWHHSSIVSAFHRGAINLEEAVRQLGEIGFSESRAWDLLATE